MRRIVLALLLPWVLLGAARKAPVAPPVRLVWHVEDAVGEPLGGVDSDVAINPASVVKLATTLRALETLGPHHRFETRVLADGRFDPATGVLDGDLLVLGGGDPDFHVENAFLLATELRRIGLRRVTGAIRVDERFWIGWEGGPSQRPMAPEARATRMAARLRAALDPARWDRSTRNAWNQWAKRHRVPATQAIQAQASGPVTTGAPAGSILATHRSNPLVQILKRFNVHSNNDIERLATSIGEPGPLAADLASRWNASAQEVSLSTLSGLGVNRLTPRLVVRLVRELIETCDRLGVAVEDLLPVAGCGRSTLSGLPGLGRGAARALVAKTGTLTQTDGGVAVLAGIAKTRGGTRLFCVAAPQSGRAIWAARDAESKFVLDLLAREGGAEAMACPAMPGLSDADAAVFAATRETAHSIPASGVVSAGAGRTAVTH